MPSLTRPFRVAFEFATSAWPQFVRPLALELVAHRPIREVLPLVYQWTAIHPKIRQPVSSHYVEASGVLLDPLVPREGLEWFEGRPVRQIVLTNRHHYRHSDRFAELFGCPVLCSKPGLHEFAGDKRKVKGFDFDTEVAPGMHAIELDVLCPDDTAFYLDEARAIVFADGLTHPRGGGLTFVPGFLMGDDPGAVRAGLRESLRGLLDLDFDSLLFAHGEPMVGDGKIALREFLERG
jgi:hypothetical protein